MFQFQALSSRRQFRLVPGISFKCLVPGAFNQDWIESTCTARPRADRGHQQQRGMREDDVRHVLGLHLVLDPHHRSVQSRPRRGAWFQRLTLVHFSAQCKHICGLHAFTFGLVVSTLCGLRCGGAIGKDKSG